MLKRPKFLRFDGKLILGGCIVGIDVFVEFSNSVSFVEDGDGQALGLVAENKLFVVLLG